MNGPSDSHASGLPRPASLNSGLRGAAVEEIPFLSEQDPAVLQRNFRFCADARCLLPTAYNDAQPPPRELAVLANEVVTAAHLSAVNRPPDSCLKSTPGEPHRDHLLREHYEMPALQQKHQQDFDQILPAIVSSLLTLVNAHQCRIPSRSVAAAFGSSIADPDSAGESGLVADWRQFNSPRPLLLLAFCKRMATKLFLSPASMVGGLIILDRLCLRAPDLVVTSYNVADLYFVAVRVASKVIELRSLGNVHFCQPFRREMPHISPEVLHIRELMFLLALKFDVLITAEEFKAYSRGVTGPED